MCTLVLVGRLGLSLPRKGVVRLSDRLDMAIDVDWDLKPQHNNNNNNSNISSYFILSFFIYPHIYYDTCIL